MIYINCKLLPTNTNPTIIIHKKYVSIRISKFIKGGKGIIIIYDLCSHQDIYIMQNVVVNYYYNA